MDLETENRIAAILLKEAAELRREAQKEGALAYLREPTVRSRPNSRFLTATVRGVQQANRAVEVNEMWRLREKQLELDKKLRGTKSESNGGRGHKDISESHTSTSRARNEVENSASASLSWKKRSVDHDPMEDESLKDDEIDQFLQSRNKRGRGSVGSRMDETGPYLPLNPDSKNMFERAHETPNKARVVLGPEKPYSLKSSEPSSHDDLHPHKNKKAKGGSSKRQHSRKHKSKEKSKDKSERKGKDKKSKHHR